MQGATIDQEKQEQQKPQAQPTGMPMLVTSDDLKLEIAEWLVASLNKDKIIKRMVALQQQQATEIASMKAAIDTAGPLAESNSKLGIKNRELGDALTAARTEAKAEIAEAKDEFKAEAKEFAKEAEAKSQKQEAAISDLRAKLKKAKADLKKKA